MSERFCCDSRCQQGRDCPANGVPKRSRVFRDSELDAAPPGMGLGIIIAFATVAVVALVALAVEVLR